MREWDLFGLPLKMKGMHSMESDHECFDLLSRETYAPGLSCSKHG